MEKTYIALITVFLAIASIGHCDEPAKENVELRFQEQGEVINQSPTSQDEIPVAVQAMHRKKFRNHTVNEIQETLENAQREGLPVKPLTDKVHEGIAKNIDEDRIVDAVDDVGARYRYAHRKAREIDLDPVQEKHLRDLIADANAAGFMDGECDIVMAALHTRTRTMNRGQAQELSIQTMTTARTMARRGVKSGTVADVMVSALEQDYQAEDMENMQDAFMHKVRYGPPDNVARRFAHGINQGLDINELGSDSARGDQKSDSSGSRGDPGGHGVGGSDSSGGSGGGSGSSGGSGGSGESSGGSDGSGDSRGSSSDSGDTGGSSGGSSGSPGDSERSDDSGGTSDSGGDVGGSDSSGDSGSSSGGSEGTGGSSGGKAGGGRGK